MCLGKCLIICQLELGIVNVVLDKNVIVFRLFNLFTLFRSYNDTSEVTESSVPSVPTSTEGAGSNTSATADPSSDPENGNTGHSDKRIPQDIKAVSLQFTEEMSAKI